ncbi:MAG TPA: hypothetical protein VJS65_15125 [Verrucomicrobiae bacterium]|nr:hypothetical protein [Verrucomicrobiae bacterium]
MRKTIVLTLLSAASASGMSKLDALSMIESADNDLAVGLAGEVSRFQIRPHIWRQYSPNPAYRNSGLARVVADRLMSDLEAEFRRRARREPTDFDRYVLWNAGPAYYAQIGYSRARVSRVVRERAVRFANLCETLPKQAPVMISTRPAAKPAMTVGTNAAPAVVFSLEPRPAQLEFPAFALQADLPVEPSPTPRGAIPAQTTAKPRSGIVAATILDGK